MNLKDVVGFGICEVQKESVPLFVFVLRGRGGGGGYLKVYRGTLEHINQIRYLGIYESILEYTRGIIPLKLQPMVKQDRLLAQTSFA